MRRYDTFTSGVKTAFFNTLKTAEDKGASRFICETTQYSISCKYCPFGDADIHDVRDKTASEWLAWANEEVEEGTKE